MKRLIQSFQRNWLSRRNHWIDKRIPAQNTSRFNLSNTFIMPSTFGWTVIAIVLFFFILGTNYQNNIVLALSYFFSALLILSLFHSYQYFTQHELHFHPFETAYEDRAVTLHCELSSTHRYPGGEFTLSSDYATKYFALEERYDTIDLHIGFKAMPRGMNVCPRLKVETYYGFGFFRCWSYLRPKHRVLVYPSAQKCQTILQAFSQNQDNSLSTQSAAIQSDALQGLRKYLDTDPIHHVSWKHMAKGQGMLSKDFSDNAGASGWLRLRDYLQEDTDEALRMLSYQVQELAKQNVQYGLDIGTTKILPQLGSAHMHKCLYQLATFGQENKLRRRESDA